MRQDHGKHDWPWWKNEIITKWAKNCWRFKIENALESDIFNSEKDKPLTLFLKQKSGLTALHPDMSDSIINMKILIKCGGEIEHAIKCQCVGPCSTANYIDAMEDINTWTRIGEAWSKNTMDSRMIQWISREDKKPERPVLEGHKCRIKLQSASNCTKSLKSGKLKSFKRLRHEGDITFNIYRPNPPVLRRPAYSASPRAREAVEKHIQEFIQLVVLRKIGHNEEVEVKKPVIIAWRNDKSRMVGDFRVLNTYTVADRYPIPRIQENVTQFSKDKYITSMD
ncbi:hypothetical protein O181_052375 [Austropuccinia psidii MF-1]|uniref:Reverse transcriptase domain-containing protein n=1 Tax=Austropuccinia psidii MF-1 TaxID=1389203 RepID=A0A9Q3E4T6_9BASI|nr:hypothetical protein [Austropuccinia psidii MF-1]